MRPLHRPMPLQPLWQATLSGLIISTTLIAWNACFPTSQAAAEEKPADVSQRQELFDKFSKSLSGATLVGQFTVEGRDRPPSTERYELESVTKLDPEDPESPYWVFLARIKYGENDAKIPMTLPVLWAGETPVISLNDLTIPGLGTFSARVLFDGNRYVGTWQHGDVGGHMWGLIEHPKASPEKSADN